LIVQDLKKKKKKKKEIQNPEFSLKGAYLLRMTFSVIIFKGREL
jgi:hypothetical protein